MPTMRLCCRMRQFVAPVRRRRLVSEPATVSWYDARHAASLIFGPGGSWACVAVSAVLQVADLRGGLDAPGRWIFRCVRCAPLLMRPGRGQRRPLSEGDTRGTRSGDGGRGRVMLPDWTIVLLTWSARADGRSLQPVQCDLRGVQLAVSRRLRSVGDGPSSLRRRRLSGVLFGGSWSTRHLQPDAAWSIID